MKVLFIKCFILISFLTYSQSTISFQSGDSLKAFNTDTSEACNKDLVFLIVEQMPVYSGGIKKLEIDLNELLSIEKELKGRLFISFTINCEGKAFGFQVVKGVDTGFDKNVINAMEKLQNWDAGKQRNIEVDCTNIIRFSISRGKLKIEQ